MAQLRRVFRSNLKRLLRERKMTQRDLAKLLGISDGAVSELINGDYSPTLDAVERVAAALRANGLSLLVPAEAEENALVSAAAS